jgi:membrane-bound metal-dependent hydrolase YbcI (DUF457 family)
LALKEELIALSFHAFEETVRTLLTRLGYAEVRLLGRTQWRQFTRHGGSDMEALIKVGVSEARVILQVKQYRRPVSRRFVDELRGVMLRSGAREGIVITTSKFSKVARTSAQAQRIAPIRLINGNELVNLLILHGLGVVCEKVDGKEWIRLEHAYFLDLDKRYPNRRKLSSRISAKRGEPALTPPMTPPRINSRNLIPMLWRTHVLAGINSLWLLYLLPGVLTPQTLPPAIVMAALGALLPDIDAAESKIKNLGAYGVTPFAPIAQFVNRTFGHRGLMHSPGTLVPVAILSVVLSFWVGVVPGISLLLGYGSHLAMDALTRSGIPLLPVSQKRFHLLPLHLRIVTGSVEEDILMFCLALAVVPLLLHFLPLAQ